MISEEFALTTKASTWFPLESNVESVLLDRILVIPKFKNSQHSSSERISPGVDSFQIARAAVITSLAKKLMVPPVWLCQRCR